MTELHELAEQPNWSTKQRCTCGYESVSKCEQWKHQADELRMRLAALTDAATGLADITNLYKFSPDDVLVGVFLGRLRALRSVLDSVPETP